MYIASYHPKDFIIPYLFGDRGPKVLNYVTLHGCNFFAAGQEIYLPAVLPSVFMPPSVSFRFFFSNATAVSNVGFAVAVDPFTNTTEDYGDDILDSFINNQITATKDVVAKAITIIDHTYSGMAHKLDGDRCMFRIRYQSNVNCTLFGVLLTGV